MKLIMVIITLFALITGIPAAAFSKDKLELEIASEYASTAIPNIDSYEGFSYISVPSTISISKKCKSSSDNGVLRNVLFDQNVYIHPMYLFREVSSRVGKSINKNNSLLFENDILSFTLSSEVDELFEIAIDDGYEIINLNKQKITLKLIPLDEHFSYLIIENEHNIQRGIIAPFYYKILNWYFMKNSSSEPTEDNGYLCKEIKYFSTKISKEKLTHMQQTGLLKKSGTLSKDMKIFGLNFKGNSRFYVGYPRALSRATLAEDTEINGVVYRGGYEIGFERSDYFNTFVEEGCHKGNIIIDGIEYKSCTNKNETIRRHSKNKVFAGTLAVDTTVDGITYRGGKEIVYHSSGKVSGGYLVGPIQVNEMGFTRRPEEYFFDIFLREDGSVASGYTSELISLSDIEIPKNVYVRFYENGNVKEITIYKNEIFDGMEIKPYTPCFSDVYDPVILFSIEGEYVIEENASFIGMCH